MQPETVIYLALSLVALSSALFATERGASWHVVLCAFLLLTFFSACTLFWTVFPEPLAYAPNPVMDFAAAWLIGMLYERRREYWKVALWACFATQIALATWFWFSLWLPEVIVPLPLSTYKWLNNAMFAVELIIVSSPGIGYVVRPAVARVLRRRRDRGVQIPQSRREG
jgi:hypothetical protein